MTGNGIELKEVDGCEIIGDIDVVALTGRSVRGV